MKEKKEKITKNNNFNTFTKSVQKPIQLKEPKEQEKLEESLYYNKQSNTQNFNFLNNATKNETAKPNENEINENNIFNINFNLYELNQLKEQEEQKDLEELEEDLNSSSRNFFFDNNF